MSDPTASPKPPPPPPPPPPATGVDRVGAEPAREPDSDAATTTPVPPPPPPTQPAGQQIGQQIGQRIGAGTAEVTAVSADRPASDSADDSDWAIAGTAAEDTPSDAMPDATPGTPKLGGTTSGTTTSGDTTSSDTPDDVAVVEPGKMRAPWRVVLAVAWGVAILALSSVWQVSVQIGHNTWWLGPAGEPHNLAIQLLPFFGPVIVLFLVIINVRGLSWWASLFALGEVAIGAIDLSVYRNLGLLEIMIGSLLLVISVASTAGRIRRPVATTALDD